MNVRNIIKLTATYLQLTDILNSQPYGTLQPDSAVNKHTSFILTCVNLVNSTLAAEYVKIKKTATVSSVEGKINFSSISSTGLCDILSVKDAFGNSVVYKIFPNYLKTVSGEVEVTYFALPEQVGLDDNITSYAVKINERIFAYGVVSEYCYINGQFDDATIWDARFKNSLQNVLSKKGEIKIKNRRWY